MTDKPPFGFRQDDDEKPEPEDEEKKEINCTSLHEQKTWSPAVVVFANPNDANNSMRPWWW